MRRRQRMLVWGGLIVVLCALIDVYRVAGVPATARWLFATDAERFRAEHGFTPPPSARGYVFRTRGRGPGREAFAGFVFSWEENDRVKRSLGDLSGMGVIPTIDPRLDVETLLGRTLWSRESPPVVTGSWDVQWDPDDPRREPSPIVTLYRDGRTGYAIVRSYGEPPP